MYFKFLLIYSYLIVNSASFPQLNYGTNIGAQYRAPAFSTGNIRPAQNNFGIRNSGVDKPINSFTGNIAVNAPLNPVNAWPNANTYPKAPPRPLVWNPASAPKPVVQNDWPYARQPAYNPHFNFVNPGSPPKPEVQKDRPYIKQQPYNPNFNVPQQAKPAIQYPGPAPRPVGSVVQSKWPPYNPHINATSKPVIQNDLPYARQPAYNPHFNFVSPGSPPRPEVQKDRPYIKQQPYNPNFNVHQQAKPVIQYPGPAPRPVGSVVQSKWPPYNPHINATPKPVVQNDWLYAQQPAYNPHFKMPPTPTPASRSLGSNQQQPPYNPHFKELIDQAIKNNGPPKLPSSTNPNHLFNIKQPAYNSHFVPPIPANRNLISNERQPSYSPLFQEAIGPTGSMERQPRQYPLMPETSPINNHVLNSITTLYPLMITGNQSNNNHGKNVASKFAGVLGAVNAFVKKFTKNYDSTNVEQIFENPVLLSTQDSEDKFAVMDLINSYSPKDSNPFGSKESMQKSLISNKLPAVHRYNLKTKQIRKGKPFILVAIVISSVAAMAALIGGIIFCSKKKK